MIDPMKAYLFGVMVNPVMPQCIVTDIQVNQMIAVVKTALSCIEFVGMTIAAKRRLAISAKKPKGNFFHLQCGILDLSTVVPCRCCRLKCILGQNNFKVSLQGNGSRTVVGYLLERIISGTESTTC